MHVEQLDFIFIHVPKTAGNFVQSNLINLGLTSAKKVVTSGRDGLDRFEIVDQLTDTKHQSLEEYLSSNQSGSLRFFSVYRDPTERLLSYYMSPHRRTRLRIKKTGVRVPFFFSRFESPLLEYVKTEQSLPSYSEFRRFATSVKSTTQQLSPGNQDPGSSSLHLLSFDAIDTCLESFLTINTGLKPKIDKRPLNKSQYPDSDKFNDLMEVYEKIVMSSHHAEDYWLSARAGQTFPLSVFDSLGDKR